MVLIPSVRDCSGVGHHKVSHKNSYHKVGHHKTGHYKVDTVDIGILTRASETTRRDNMAWWPHT